MELLDRKGKSLSGFSSLREVIIPKMLCVVGATIGHYGGGGNFGYGN